MLTTVGMTRATSGARLGIAMSISFWVCRVRFEPPVGSVSPGGWALHNAGARIRAAQTALVRLHRVRPTLISGNPKANSRLAKEDAQRRQKVPVETAIRAHGRRGRDQFLQ